MMGINNESPAPKKVNEIDRNMNVNVKSLQKSTYIQIENDTIRLKKHFIPENVGNELVLKFCLPHEVNAKRHNEVIQQTGFLAKLNHMKLNGMSIDLMSRVDEWLDEHLDCLFKQNHDHSEN